MQIKINNIEAIDLQTVSKDTFFKSSPHVGLVESEAEAVAAAESSFRLKIILNTVNKWL
jgi:hypothetical protein